MYIQILFGQMKIEKLLKTSIQLPASKKLVLNIIVTANYIQESLTEVLKQFELSSQQFNVLRILRGQNGNPANLGTIQERMVSRMSNTTRLVDKLIQKGLAERMICPSNRRKVEIRITEAGLALLTEIDPLIINLEESISANINEEELKFLNQKLNAIRS